MRGTASTVAPRGDRKRHETTATRRETIQRNQHRKKGRQPRKLATRRSNTEEEEGVLAGAVAASASPSPSHLPSAEYTLTCAARGTRCLPPNAGLAYANGLRRRRPCRGAADARGRVSRGGQGRSNPACRAPPELSSLLAAARRGAVDAWRSGHPSRADRSHLEPTTTTRKSA